MESNNGKLLFLDSLNFNSFLFLLRKGLYVQVILLDRPPSRIKLFSYFLKLKGYNISEASFFAGNLKTENDEATYVASIKSARKIAVDAVKEILETNHLLNDVNEYFGRNTLHLHLTKQLIWYVKYWSERLTVAKVLAGESRYQVCIKLPDRINPQVISNAFVDTEIHYYGLTCISFIGRIKKPIALCLELFRLFLFPFNGKRKSAIQVKQNVDKPAVLLLQEDTIRADTSLRGQPHWFDFEKSENRYRTYILKSSIDNEELSSETKAQFANNNIFVLDTTAFKDAFSQMRYHNSLNEIRAYRKKLLKSLLSLRGFKNTYFIIRTALFLKQAEYMGAISLWLNVKVFLFRESYIPLTDAIQIVTKKINVKTIAYQYSNLGTFSPVMMNTSDLMLVFSDQFKKLFADQYFSPASILETGYLYDGLPDKIRERALLSRNILFSKGVQFIICFFDESVQHDKWGLISKADHLGELHSLAEAVLNDPTMGVVIKSQFLRNSPSQLYPADELIARAASTGRFIELHTGSRRNDIFPAEAALMSDIAIGHKFGATASLEASAEGVRSVMLDAYGTKMIWDEFYDREYITFSTMESLMEAINQLRLKNENYQNLGDWSSFLDQLIKGKDGKSVKRLREIVEKECLEIITDVDN